MSEPLHPDEILGRPRYMGRQYSAGQYARGGGHSKHYLEEAADLIESLTAEREALKAEVEGLRADATRYRYIRTWTRGVQRHDGSQRFVFPAPFPLADIMQGSVAQHLDSAIDAARAGDGK